MRARRKATPHRAPLLLNMHLEMIGPVAPRRFERVGRLNAKAAERTMRHILREFIQHIQILLYPQVARNPFQYSRNSLHPQTAGHALSARFSAQIAATLHRPGDHARLRRQQLNYPRANYRPGLLKRIEIERGIEQRRRQSAPLGTAYHNRTQLALRSAIAGVTQNLAQRRSKGSLNHLWLALRHRIIDR